MKKGTFVIALFTGILGLGAAGAALAQSSNANPIILKPGSGNQQIQRGDDGMQSSGGMKSGGEHEGMGSSNSHSGGMNGSGGMGGEGGSEGGGEMGG